MSQWNLVNEFGNHFKDKIDAIWNNLGASEPPSIPTRKVVDDKLDTFALVSADDVRKLVMKSKTTSCALDPTTTKLVKEYSEELHTILIHDLELRRTAVGLGLGLLISIPRWMIQWVIQLAPLVDRCTASIIYYS